MPRYNYDQDDVEDEFYAVDPYPEIRRVLAPEFTELDAEEIEYLIEQNLRVNTEDLEDFLGSLGNAWRTVSRAVAPVAKVIAPALPTVLGAAGTLVGGPIGTMAGTAAGKALQGALSGSQGQRTIQPGSTTTQGPSSHPPQPAAAQLLQMLSRPEIMQGLSSMLLGGLGSGQVQVGHTQVPTGAIANLLGVLSNRALAEFNAVMPSRGQEFPNYLINRNGEFVVNDPANPEDQADALLALFEQVNVEQFAPESVEEEGILDDEDVSDLNQELYDTLDLIEAYFIENEGE